MRTPKAQPPVVVHPTEPSIEPKDFVKIEKNLNTLGFFTPAKHRGAKSSEKIVFFRRELNGKTIEAQATILPSAKYGLPTTADLDKYLAFHKLLEQRRNEVGEISNPVDFTSTQLLTVLGIKDAGNNYQDIHEWLQRMTLTGINSKGHRVHGPPQDVGLRHIPRFRPRRHNGIDAAGWNRGGQKLRLAFQLATREHQ